MSSPVQLLAEQYLENVKVAGDDNLRAECPFHNSSSSSRSLYIFTQTGGWTCFGCRAGGSMPSLLYKLGYNYHQVQAALDRVKFAKWTPQSMRSQISWKKGDGWSVLPEWILGAYDWRPQRMVHWGFTDEILQEFQIGYDEQHKRITFPIRDYTGRLACISGRAEPGGFPRYKVYEASPPSGENNRAGELYGVLDKPYTPDNRLHIFGLDKFHAHRFGRPLDEDLPPAVLVEGYKGCLWMHQLGFGQTGALQGSSMTRMQERAMGLVRGPYIVLLDNEPGKSFPDAEGRCSAYRITERMSRYGKALVCQYPDGSAIGTSPDDLTADELQKMIDSAMTTAQARLTHTTRHLRQEGWRRAATPTTTTER